MDNLAALPPAIGTSLDDFLKAAQSSLGSTLKVVVLYGSAAEGRVRQTSDVNLILVLDEFKKTEIDALREPYRLARAACKLQVMFLLASEVKLAANAFPLKFFDIIKRNKILYGEDPFRGVKFDPGALVVATRQTLTNLALRLRERYALLSLRKEQLIAALADAASPLRTAASAMSVVRGEAYRSPKEALYRLTCSLGRPELVQVLDAITAARDGRELPSEDVEGIFLDLLQLPVTLLSALDQGAQ